MPKPPHRPASRCIPLQAHTVYQRNSYSQATRGRHVVITGSLDATSVGHVLDELCHAGKQLPALQAPARLYAPV